jgi:hypothetical protein
LLIFAVPASRTCSISLTCDAWQASNANSYFAVTGSWIAEISPGHWEQQSALFGFVRMNSAHNSCHLGTALYKTCNWLGIAHKIGWVTCDNVSNNTLMMMCFAAIVQQATGKEFNAVKQQIRWVSCHYFFLMSGSLITKVSCAHYQPCDAGCDIKILRVKVL